MTKTGVFVDRRRRNRRRAPDPCKQLPMDLYHRKRRKSSERRCENRSLLDDYHAFSEAAQQSSQSAEPAEH